MQFTLSRRENRWWYNPSMKERIAITGSKGTIGTVLRGGLSRDFEIKGIDLHETDERDYGQVLEAFRNCSAVIHLAWNPKIENYKSQELDPQNRLMYENVYRAALESGVKRVVMASSIHADDFYSWGESLMSPYQKAHPKMPYGEDKVEMEQMGREYAKKGLEVICIRFGGINPANKAPKAGLPRDMATWLSHNDCTSLIDAVLRAKSIPNNFAIVYAVSDNEGRVSDVSNSFGWHPKEHAKDFV